MSMLTKFWRWLNAEGEAEEDAASIARREGWQARGFQIFFLVTWLDYMVFRPYILHKSKEIDIDIALILIGFWLWFFYLPLLIPKRKKN